MPLLRFTGKVKFYNPSRGFGFIYVDDQMPNVFFHITSIRGSAPPRVGDELSFYLKESKGKMVAFDAAVTPHFSKDETRNKAGVTKKELDGFPCIPGASIRGFRIDGPMVEISTSRHGSVAEARTRLIEIARYHSANAIFNYVWYRESDLRNAVFLIWYLGKYRDTYYWAEGTAVKLVRK